MKELPQKWSNAQVGWIVLWAISVCLSIVFYSPRIISALKHSNSTCTLQGFGSSIANMLQPEYWLAYFSIILTIVGISWLYKNLSSNYPWITDYSRLALAVFAAALLIIIEQGCSK